MPGTLRWSVLVRKQLHKSINRKCRDWLEGAVTSGVGFARNRRPMTDDVSSLGRFVGPPLRAEFALACIRQPSTTLVGRQASHERSNTGPQSDLIVPQSINQRTGRPVWRPMAGPRRRGGGSGAQYLLLRLLLLAAVGPLAAWGFGPFGTGGSNSLRGDCSTSVAGGRQGGWVPPALRPVVRVSRRPIAHCRRRSTDRTPGLIDLIVHPRSQIRRWPSWRAEGSTRRAAARPRPWRPRLLAPLLGVCGSGCATSA